jgi:hypothetical protein
MDHSQAINPICEYLSIQRTQWLLVIVGEQCMYYYWRDRLEAAYGISTAKDGVCQIRDSPYSNKIAENIGDEAPWGRFLLAAKIREKFLQNMRTGKRKAM